MASVLEATDETPIACIRRELEEKTDELRIWRIRCLQAEAEVRALKYRTRHADPMSSSGAAIEQYPAAWADGACGNGSLPSGTSPHGKLRYEDEVLARRPDRKPSLRSSMSGDRVAGRNPTGAEVRECGVQKDASHLVDGEELAALRQELAELRANFESGELVAAGAVPTTSAGASENQQFEDTSEATKQSMAEEGNRSEELEELQQQIQHKNFTIVQLQADTVREKQQLERQRKSAESQNIFCLEELRQMTNRAESLSEQVKKSKRKANELQVVRDEAAKLHGDLEECEARLVSQASVIETLDATCNEVRFELSSSRNESKAATHEGEVLRSEVAARTEDLELSTESFVSERYTLEQNLAAGALEAAKAREEHAAELSRLEAMNAEAAEQRRERDATADVEDGEANDQVANSTKRARDSNVWKGRQQRMVHCVGNLNQLHAELLGELQTKAANLASFGVASKMGTQLERVRQLLEGSVGATGVSPCPEAEHPVGQFPGVLQRPVCHELGTTMQQEMNEHRIAAEVVREELIAEHCDDLDDLVRRHDLERRSLNKEISELRAEITRAGQSSFAAQPGMEIREHFEQQVAMVKHELIAQLSEFHERQSEQRGDDERELEQLRQTFESCQAELFASQEEFTILATLFEKERRDNMQLREDLEIINHRAAQQAALHTPRDVGEPLAPPVGTVAIGSSHEMSPETTETWDSPNTVGAEREKAVMASGDRTGELAQQPGAQAWLAEGREPQLSFGSNAGVRAAHLRTAAPPPPSSSGGASRPSSTGTARGASTARTSPSPTPRMHVQRTAPPSSHSATTAAAAGASAAAAVAAATAGAQIRMAGRSAGYPFAQHRAVTTV
mmetsp:Transcript_115829/g.327687  ORF Transcript_115829/g.327687 Transcript_115829/m.327687 type:complete len:855 (+) Transcript_115829:66-2630(+)